MKNIIAGLATFFALTGFAFAQKGQFTGEEFYTRDAAGKISGYVFPPLPYSYQSLQPAIDSLTMSIHYDRHHRAYYTNFVKAVEETPLKGKPLEEIFSAIGNYSESLRNNGGGYYNHTFFWKNMAADGGGRPSGALASAIDKQFESFDKFKEIFGEAAKGRFGSGWAWLILDKNNTLQVTTTPNQDNPLMDVAKQQGVPLLAIDVWEHAYYLKYQNKRADYIKAFWNIVDWKEVERRYSTALRQKP